MVHQVLLISRDPLLAGRVRQALPAGIASELHCAERFVAPPASPPPGAAAAAPWLLVLLDEQSLGAPGGAGAESRALAPSPETPLIWLGHAPPADAASLPGTIVDAVGREACGSKLALVVRQHFAAAYLRRVRARPLAGGAEPGPRPIALHQEFNNALTGLLGNAELALHGGARLPQTVRLRLQRIFELASRLRDLATAAPARDKEQARP